MSRVPIEWVRWYDATSSGETWRKRSEKTHLECVDSVGFLLHEDDQSVTLVGSLTNAQYGNDFTIPKGCIIKRTVLHG